VVNEDAVEQAKRLIDARQYVLRSRWQNVQPRARDQNAFLKTHSWEEYAAWHLGLTEGALEETKARSAFVYGDFRRVHRMGLIVCHDRAAEWRHKEIELAAHEFPAVPRPTDELTSPRRRTKRCVLEKHPVECAITESQQRGSSPRLNRQSDGLRRAVSLSRATKVTPL